MTAPATPIDPVLVASLGVIADFIQRTTGTAPTPDELADALTRYFVLNEIREHIVMLRERNSEESDPPDA